MTYGEFIKTKEAKVKADSHIRKYIHQSLKTIKGSKLVKYARGAPGTLDYGRVVVMLAHPMSESSLELARMRNKKPKDYIWILRADFGQLTMAVGDVHQPIDSYKSKAAAEKKYAEYVRWYLKG
jgi:hypothetical protein